MRASGPVAMPRSARVCCTDAPESGPRWQPEGCQRGPLRLRLDLVTRLLEDASHVILEVIQRLLDALLLRGDLGQGDRDARADLRELRQRAVGHVAGPGRVEHLGLE